MELDKINVFFNTKEKFTNEDILIVSAMLLERSTFYTCKILDLKLLALKAESSEIYESIMKDIDDYYKIKFSLDKFLDLLKYWG